MSTLQPARQLLPGLLAMSCALPVFAANEGGFMEDAKATLNLRNFYINRNFVDPAHPQGKAEEWTQSFILDARSGFTQGTVGFGVDVLGLYSVKLDGGKGTTNTQLLPVHDDGRPADDFGRLGVALKAKLSETELKVGEWMPVLPILRSDDGRSLPQTFRGGQLTSKEIAGLTLYAGQFRGNSPRNDASMEDMSMNGKGAFTSDRFNFGGGEYTFNDKRTMIGLWDAQLKDIYHQQYLNLTHSQPLGDWTWAPTWATSSARKTAQSAPASWTTAPPPPCFRRATRATPSTWACRRSAATTPGCGSTVPVAAPWPTIATTPASTTPRSAPGSCAMTSTSQPLACLG